MAGELEKIYGVTNAWLIVLFVYGTIMVLLGLYNRKMLPSGGVSKQVHSLKESFTTLVDVIITFFKKRIFDLVYASLFFTVLQKGKPSK